MTGAAGAVGAVGVVGWAVCLTGPAGVVGADGWVGYWTTGATGAVTWLTSPLTDPPLDPTPKA
jgi:hypothetical protein